MRIPYTTPLPAPVTFPPSVRTFPGAVDALARFLTADRAASRGTPAHKQTLLLTGAGISVASGLADYRGRNGTYTLNKTYRPIYFGEFCASHPARQRYWARSFLGWPTLHRSQPNAAHHAVARLGRGAGGSSSSSGFHLVPTVITQNVDSFHPAAHPTGPATLELHGALRRTVCLTCGSALARDAFQAALARLNPRWADFLAEIQASGALDSEDPAERHRRGLRTNPDGDVDVPGVAYESFRYPPCPTCLAKEEEVGVRVDADGAWQPPARGMQPAGVLKPAVIMFGESIPAAVKVAAEEAVDAADRMLVLGSSLATYSAWRLAKRAHAQGKPVAIVNLGGVRGEEQLFAEVLARTDAAAAAADASEGVRCEWPLEELLPAVVERLEETLGAAAGKGKSARTFTPAPWA